MLHATMEERRKSAGLKDCTFSPAINPDRCPQLRCYALELNATQSFGSDSLSSVLQSRSVVVVTILSLCRAGGGLYARLSVVSVAGRRVGRRARARMASDPRPPVPGCTTRSGCAVATRPRPSTSCPTLRVYVISVRAACRCTRCASACRIRWLPHARCSTARLRVWMHVVWVFRLESNCWRYPCCGRSCTTFIAGATSCLLPVGCVFHRPSVGCVAVSVVVWLSAIRTTETSRSAPSSRS